MLIEQTIEFELRGPGSSNRITAPKTGYLLDKTKMSMSIIRVIIYCEKYYRR